LGGDSGLPLMLRNVSAETRVVKTLRTYGPLPVFKITVYDLEAALPRLGCGAIDVENDPLRRAW
jgi:hypothetical protein